MPINSKNAKINGETVEIPPYVAGHFLWEAMGEFRKAYTDLTNTCHRLSEDAGGPIPQGSRPDVLPSVAHFTTAAKHHLDRMQDALKRADMFAYGEVYDDLIDRTLLGPNVEAVEGSRKDLRRVYVEDKPTRDVDTFVYGENTGMHVYMGVSINDTGEEGFKPQPYVVVSTEGLSEQYVAENGEPILAVSLNDATLYDKEKE